MAIKLVAGPLVEPVSLAEAKTHLRVDYSEDDLWIQTAIEAARGFAEKFCARAFVTQTWDLVIDQFPTNEIMIPLPPLQSVMNIYYNDTTGNEVTLGTDKYDVDTFSEPGWVVPATGGWPTAVFDGINSVRIRFVAGYPPTADSPPDLAGNVPSSIKSAILLQLGTLYAQRESVVLATIANKIPEGGILHLLRQYRVALGMA